MDTLLSRTDIPAHIPAEFVRDCRLFDLSTTFENPYETLIPEIHTGPPVFYTKMITQGPMPGWVVRRAEDLRAIYADTDNFYKQGNTRFARMIGETWDIIPTELDPPRHTSFRNVLNPIFSPRAMAALDNQVRERARFFINKFKDQGGCEFVEDFAVPFPVTIFLDLLGLPQEEMPQMLDWENKFIRATDMDERISSVRAVKNYLAAAIEARRKNPTGDLISNALNLEVDGRKWTDEEVLGHCFNLFIGGLDTVSSNLGWHFLHLATHQDQQDQLRANSASVVTAIEELLRAYAVVSTVRICRKPYELGGATFMPGDYISMSTALAGRDPEAFENPGEVRFDRKPTHLTLGFGPHRCLGQHLARRELQIAMQEFLAAVPSFKVKNSHKTEFFLGNILHVENLPLVW